jgi:mycofactocin system glycosyltransferase
VPARNAAASLAVLLSSLPAGLGEVVVVDDGSSDGTGCVASRAGARVVKADGRGPAAARNKGLAEVATPYVLFLDADTVVTAGAVELLAAHLADPAVGAVAPRIGASGTDASLLARYEAARSPLDAGPESGRVRRGGRIAFVPSAALLVRKDALDDVGGFDEELSTGEDIDLEWRLDEAGWVVRYEAGAVVEHDHRVRLAPLLSRRFAYGRPSAALDRRHPGAFAAVVTERMAAVAMIVGAGVAATSGPVAGAVTGAALASGSCASRIASLVRDGVPAADAAALVAKDQVVAARSALFAVTRSWLPAALVIAALNRRARRALVAVLIARHLADWRRLDPPIGPAQWVALRVVDDLAFAVGVWSGVRAERHAGPLAARPRRNPRESAPEWTVLARYG